MKGYVSIFTNPDEIELRLRAVKPERNAGSHATVGTALRVLKPGDTAFGWSYEELARHGDGEIEIVE